MKKLTLMNHQIKSKIFKRLFFSYLFIVLICFVAYMYVVVHEASRLRREQMNQYYTTKVQDLTTLIDHQLIGAQNMVTNINSSLIINKLYTQIRTKESIEPYVVSQTMDVLKLAKASSNNLNIYNVVVLFDQYDRAYSSSEVIHMDEKFMMPELMGVTSQFSTLNVLIGQDNPQLQFNKEFLIYKDDYRYNLGTRKGMIFVLFNQQSLVYQIDKILTDTMSWKILYKEEVLLSGGEEGSKSFIKNSRVNNDFAYEIQVDAKEFKLTYDPIWVIALFVGFAVCLAFIVFAYVFSSRFYQPFKKIRALLGVKNEAEEPEFKDFIESVECLVSERNGYKEKVLTISPYAQKGILHSILSGNVDDYNLKALCAKDIMDLEHFYFILAVINIGYVGKEAIDPFELKKLRKIISELAREKSNKSVQMLCYEADQENIYLVINTDEGERIEDLLYEFYETLELRSMNHEYIVTMGTDDVKDEVCNLYESFRPATLALYGMVTGGRGAVYFYDHEMSALNDYYFPKEGTKQLSKAIRDHNRSGINALYRDIFENNMKDYEISITGIMSLLDELYIMTANAVKSSLAAQSLILKVEKLHSVTTLQEAIDYYENACYLACDKTNRENKETPVSNKIDESIIRFVDDNYRDLDISLSKITDTYAVSNKYITYVFKKYFGITYLQYVHEKRIRYAVHLIDTLDLPLEKVATDCGYTNLLTFRRNFQSIMGMNPSDYKETKEK